LVRWELKGKNGLSWKSGLSQDLISEADKRKQQELDLGCVDAISSNLLSYLSLSELKDVLVSPALWDTCFKASWGAQDIVLSDFKRLIAVRNKVAHFRSVSQRDFRLVERFHEDLNYRTRNYDFARSTIRRINVENYKELGGELADDALVLAAIEVIAGIGGFETNQAVIHSLGSHWGLEIHVEAGSIDGEQFLAFISQFHKAISVCRIGSLGEKLEVQFSKKIPIDKAKQLVTQSVSLISNVVSGISSDESKDLYQINMREDVLPWEFEFPSSYKS